MGLIECPRDAALRDCRGCQIMDLCKADLAAMREEHSKPVVDAGRCTSCPAMRICQAIVAGGSWNPYGNGSTIKPCPGCL
jgi:hypothetical protein